MIFFGFLTHIEECKNKHEVFPKFEELTNQIMEMLEQFETSANKNSFYANKLIKVVEGANISNKKIVQAIEEVAKSKERDFHN